MDVKKIIERLKEIESRAEKATPGPWEWDEVPEDGVGRYWRMWSQDEWLSDPEVLGPYPEGDDLLSIEVRSTDADFIAHAREDIPWLVGIVRDLLKRLGACEEFLKAMQRFQDKLVCDICGERLEHGMVYCAHESCWKVREERLRKLEAVAEAAREVVKQTSPHEEGISSCDFWQAVDKLEQALAALEEDNGQD